MPCLLTVVDMAYAWRVEGQGGSCGMGMPFYARPSVAAGPGVGVQTPAQSVDGWRRVVVLGCVVRGCCFAVSSAEGEEERGVAFLLFVSEGLSNSTLLLLCLVQSRTRYVSTSSVFMLIFRRRRCVFFNLCSLLL